MLHAAWLIDTAGERAARTEIAALKVLTPKVIQSIVLRAARFPSLFGADSFLAQRKRT